MKNNIIGIGADVVNIARIESVFKKFGRKFIEKNYHRDEIEVVDKLPEHKILPYLSKRFAAKEAIAKALGKGIGAISFSDIAVINNEDGAPEVKINPKKQHLTQGYSIHISLSDDAPFAVAFAVISK